MVTQIQTFFLKQIFLTIRKTPKTIFNAAARSIFIRANLSRQQSSFTIKNCYMGNSEGESVEDLTLMQISGLAVTIMNTTLSGFSGSIPDFGSLLEIEASSTVIESTSFSNLYFPRLSNTQTGLVSISSTRVQDAEILILNSKFMDITIGQMPLLSIMVLTTVNITIGDDSLFSQIYWKEQLFSFFARDLTISFINSTLNLSGASNQPAPIGFTIQNPNADIIFQNTRIVWGLSRQDHLLKFGANDKRNITILDCLIVSESTEQ